jgi:hypothetical protein
MGRAKWHLLKLREKQRSKSGGYEFTDGLHHDSWIAGNLRRRGGSFLKASTLNLLLKTKIF